MPVLTFAATWVAALAVTVPASSVTAAAPGNRPATSLAPANGSATAVAPDHGAAGTAVAPGTGAPAPDAALPVSAAALAAQLRSNDARLRAAIGAWRTRGDPSSGGPPQDVTLEALFQQRALRMLARNPSLAGRTIRRLAPRLARNVREVTTAMRNIRRLSAGSPAGRRLTTAPALPLLTLDRYYREAQRRFGTGRHVLAAVHLLETAFGKVLSHSSAGAQGPMQFLPATWRAYGLGGDIQDPHDAILGAANYLRASGAPRNYARALYAYNHSDLYVDAILRYARFIDRDRDALYMLYSWQVFAKARDGSAERVTGPGLP